MEMALFQHWVRMYSMIIGWDTSIKMMLRKRVLESHTTTIWKPIRNI